MKPAEIIDLLVATERLFPVDKWSVGGVRIWPLVRVRLYHALFLHAVSGDARTVTQGQRRVAQLKAISRGAMRCLAARLRDRRHEAPLGGPVDVAFLSDGVSFAWVEGAWYEKFCDPIISRLRAEGASSCLLVPLAGYLVPRHTPSRFVQPRIDFENLRGAACTRQTPDDIELGGFEEAIGALGRRQLQVPLPTTQTVIRDASRLMSVASFFERRLRQLRPAAVMVVSYYSLENMAFTLASYRLGIPSFDIQHGAAGDANAAYGMWTRVPRDGYELLPNFFWCWTDPDADAIDRWAEPLGGRHRAVVGGNPWLVLWQSERDPAIERAEIRVRQAMSRHPSTRHILITLQYGLAAPEHIGGVLNAMARSPENWHWWVRLHPAQLGNREVIRRMIRDAGRRDFELDLSTDLPLYAVLKHVEVHVTHSSNVVVEAAAFGVPTVFLSEYGAALFPEYVRQRWAALANTPEEILESVDRVAAGRAALDPAAVPLPNRDKSGFDTLMRIVKRRRELREIGPHDRRD